MDTTPRTASIRTILRRGLGAAGAAVVVAFVGTAGLGAGQARAAGIEGPLRPYAAAQAPRHPHLPKPAAHPANLPPATSLAVRYAVRDGELIQL